LKIPITNQLKKRQQVEVALLQDELISLMYAVSDDLILHGGTAIWRCFSGKRFSEDLDFYSISFPEKLMEFEKTVRTHGLELRKVENSGNVIFSTVSNGRSIVKLEINHRSIVAGVNASYELVDGTYIEILSLTRNQFIIEKIRAYEDRRFIRDLYDIFHLVSVENDLGDVRSILLNFMERLEKPVDESVLKSIVYAGIPPTFDRMVEQIRRRIQ
jgi:predicted nucleotidyltransferase component of viral defense system